MESDGLDFGDLTFNLLVCKKKFRFSYTETNFFFYSKG